MNDKPMAAVLAVIEALERLEVPYYIGGSLASSTYGEYRASLDADLVADLSGAGRHRPVGASAGRGRNGVERR